jgi:hypothetical protein
MKVRLNGQKTVGAIARLEALLAGMILTVSTAYATTVCPMYWTQLQLEAELRSRLAIAQALDSQRASGRQERVVTTIPGEPYCLDSTNSPSLSTAAKN